MATKAQIINFILETFEDSEGNLVSKSKLESYKKADLETFIKEKGVEPDFEKWLANQ